MKRQRHLRYHLYRAPSEHPQVAMKNLGISYVHSTPQTMGDQWWFWNCKNIPDKLPKYLEDADLDPFECIGYGLSKADAIKISKGESQADTRPNLERQAP